MRIVHVVRQFHPAVGGLEGVVLELCARQAKQGHAVRVVTLDRIFNAPERQRLPARDSVAGAQVIRLPFYGSQRYPIAPGILRHIGDADIVHVHGIDFFFDALAWTAVLHRKRLVVSTHGGFFHTRFAAGLKRAYFRTVTRLSMKAYAAAVAVSPADEDAFRPIRPRGLVCIENGADIDRFAGAGSSRPCKAILSLGRLSSNKRLDRLIAFLAALRRLDAGWSLTIAGRPWDVTASDLRQLAREHGVAEAVTVLEAPSDAAIREAASTCSVFGTASEYEGFGLAAVEALSAGLVPLLSDIPPFRRLVQQTGLGFVLDFTDPQDCALRFVERWREIEPRYAACRQACMTAARRYEWESVSQRYLSLYAAALGQQTRSILDIPVRPAAFPEAMRLLDECFDHGTARAVAFANAHALNVASTDADFAAALRQAIVFNDGIGTDIASRLLFGAKFPDNLNGTDFVPRYLAESRHAFRIFLLGGRPGVAERAGRALLQRAPRHAVVGTRDGYFPPADTPKVIDDIRRSGADVLLVAMGNPQQELWLHAHLPSTGAVLGFGVGALFDFLAGEVPRAPTWVRAARIEWLYRLAQEPRRLWTRYVLGNPAFLLRLLGQWWSGARIGKAN